MNTEKIKIFLFNEFNLKMFSFLRMKAPSFFIAEESNEGVTMEYRSKRRGFQFYVQGQIKELSKNFANEIKKLEIELKKQEAKMHLN